jgi:hypothetical protein
MQIFILGMHRYGTSLTSRLINMMGGYFGPEGSGIPLSADNPKGHWERQDVMRINAEMLKSRKCTWHHLANWNFENITPSDKLRQTMKVLILNLDAHRPWFLKDPRLCLTFPAWRPLLEVPLAVLAYRDPVEIAVSLQKRNKLPLDYAIALWEYYAVSLLNATQDVPRIFVQHSAMLQKPVKTSEALFEQLITQGVRRLDMPSTKEIRAFIDPRLYHARADLKTGIMLTPEQALLAEILQGTRPQTEVLQISNASRSVIGAGLPAAA